MHFVFYKINGSWYCTTADNYNSRIMNARKIKRVPVSDEELDGYIAKYWYREGDIIEIKR